MGGRSVCWGHLLGFVVVDLGLLNSVGCGLLLLILDCYFGFVVCMCCARGWSPVLKFELKTLG